MKSTHSGHCQACGRLQKMPNGRLSKHGYKVVCRFFSGECRGCEELAFEESCELVQKFIASAKSALTHLEERQAALRVPATSPVAVVSVYTSTGNGRYGGRYEWQKLEIQSKTVTHPHATWEEFFVVDRYGKTHKIEKYEHKTALDIATDRNRKYADWLQHEVESLRNYIAWQQERVATWTPKPLIPNETADGKKDGFSPVKPKYEMIDTVA